MKAVGIKQLKARLSEYVRLARGGEVILVSDRDEIVAELGPACHRVPEVDSPEAALARLIEQGQVSPPTLPKGTWRWAPVGLDLPRERVDDLLGELRSDR